MLVQCGEFVVLGGQARQCPRAEGFEIVDFGLPRGQSCPQLGDFGFQPVDLGQAGVGLLPGGAGDAALLLEFGAQVRVGAVEGGPRDA
ncbi:hypothetical protein ACFWAY_05290 [Rhodococcus sp. NPDC059968]|uniref:hypothetical protein n=1 Tax=Rhodococcus sp. NPDC059968 TaxID=3347017 RepID=UPI003670EB05